MKLIDRRNFLIEAYNGDSIFCISIRGFTLHLGVVCPEMKSWGYQEDWWNGPLPSIGLGSFGLLCWMYSVKESLRWDTGER